jgi:hypothetical protein
MLLSVFHTTDPRLFPVMLSHAFGTNLFLVWIPFALVGAWSMRSARPIRSARFLLVTPVLMIPLFWFGVPDNVDSRFLLPPLLALLPWRSSFAPATWERVPARVFGAGPVARRRLRGCQSRAVRQPGWARSMASSGAFVLRFSDSRRSARA